MTIKSPLILAVDDDLELLDTHQIRLSAEGWQIKTASTLVDAERILNETVPDLLVLDRMFATEVDETDSLHWLVNLRQHVNPQLRQMRVLMLTHRNEPDDEADEMDAGANYHLNKPFSYRQLVAVVKRILRDRDAEFVQQTDMLQVGPMVVYLAGKRVMCQEREVSLTDKEYHLLSFFASKPNEILSKEAILANVWDESYIETTQRLVDNYVKRIRQLPNRIDPTLVMPIFTVHGRGYVYRPTMKLGNLTLDFRTQTLACGDSDVAVSAAEFLFLTAFTKRKEKVRLNLKKSLLCREIWNDDSPAIIPQLDALVTQLRAKIEAAGCGLPIIEFDDVSYRFRSGMVS